ncbi:hypothetical protein ACJVC5_09310 [Peredibacter sp. HCB2-198]|uniref:hypothetical protein n=1 Tax=Peredibacter sp. HCB2-198 TaxID=3383025 RepID=UPI0038B69E88
MFITVSGCSWRKDPKPSSTELVSLFSNNWFSVNPNHSLVGQNGEPVSHMMFDTTPEFNQEEQSVNVLIATPQKSEHAYQYDLNSGQRFYSHSYCKQKDIWHKYDGSINRPPFAIGYIPRVLDQLGDPQKIIVFSNRSNFASSVAFNYFRTKIVGAYVEQVCPEGNCIGKSNWLSRLVFIGIDEEDTSIAVNNTSDFAKVFNWESAKAHLENIDGLNSIGDQLFPMVRIGSLIEYNEAFDYFKKRSIFLTDAELKKIQKGCYSLYDSLWEDVGRERPEDKGAATKEELQAKVKLIEEMRKKKLPIGFSARLAGFTKKYYNEISTCEKFVYHGNINRDPEKFWFLSYMGIYYRLHREGYFYDCRSKTWKRNTLDAKGELIYDLKTEISECRDSDIDRAMEYLPNFLTGLKGEKEFYKFLDYDNYTFGTHQKMYSWVKVRSRRLDCGKDPNIEVRKETRVFPEEVSWKVRYNKDTYDNKIIY